MLAQEVLGFFLIKLFGVFINLFHILLLNDHLKEYVWKHQDLKNYMYGVIVPVGLVPLSLCSIYKHITPSATMGTVNVL